MSEHKPRIVVTYVEAGMGHITSARAISDALKRYYGDQAEILDVYFFQYQNDKSMIEFEHSTIEQVRISNKVKGWGDVWFQAMQFGGNPQKLLKVLHNSLFPAIKKKSFDLIDELKPDILVATHYLPAHFGLEYQELNPHSKMKTVIYDPDNNVHGWWDIRADLLITNNEYATEEAVEKGFIRSKVKTVNFLARDNVLNTNGTKGEYRKKYGLRQNVFTVVLADGAYASANMMSFTRELLKTEYPLNVIAVAGKNKRAYKALNKCIEDEKVSPSVQLLPFGFTTDICELYRAADVFVTKAGPNAIVDSMFMHTPIIVNYWASPIELFTNELFINHYGCGETIKSKVKCRKRIEQFITNPKLLDPYIEKTNRFDKTQNGSKKAADYIIAMLKK